ncbi:GDP-mannose 4,6-dehydratase [Acidithiobacillus sp. AMEEHan]|uniref:GDP-mannose 4,6-dehydratase n=1 Tax=Acidithiobacillus sp. AMEEHan TaxID=2994951 RepID=UPI0027E51E33|nr:GDP-mannose 4,6-dehydratase [Acidithiobacillus sp. AMEEHan]
MLKDINRYNTSTARQITEHFHAKRVLVTGGFGFVGGHVARHLLNCGAELALLDIDTSPDRPSMVNCPRQGIREKVRIIEADVTDKKMMLDIIDEGRFHYIFHFAAYASVIEKALNAPYDTIMANTMGWIKVLRCFMWVA